MKAGFLEAIAACELVDAEKVKLKGTLYVIKVKVLSLSLDLGCSDFRKSLRNQLIKF